MGKPRGREDSKEVHLNSVFRLSTHRSIGRETKRLLGRPGAAWLHAKKRMGISASSMGEDH